MLEGSHLPHSALSRAGEGLSWQQGTPSCRVIKCEHLLVPGASSGSFPCAMQTGTEGARGKSGAPQQLPELGAPRCSRQDTTCGLGGAGLAEEQGLLRGSVHTWIYSPAPAQRPPQCYGWVHSLRLWVFSLQKAPGSTARRY